MLSIWIGRAGAGKSRRVLETMARQRSQRPQVLLVPEHISHEAEVDLCRALGPTASRDAEVLSFQSLGSRVLARTGGLAEFTLDGGGKLLTMRLALQELHSRLKVFGRPSQRAAFLRQLTDLTEEFYAYEITPQDLWQQVEDMEGAMGDKLRDLALLYAAYASQTLRGALKAVPMGQWESGQALGLSKSAIFFRLVMPQMWRHALPGLGNQWLVLLKDTALVSLISVNDLMLQTKSIATRTQEPFTWYIVAAAIYLVITLLSQYILKRIDLRATRFERRPG